MKKTTILAGIALALTASFATAGGDGWMTDFEAAKKKAATEKKDLLVDFTGSDWCSWCIKLNDEVFKHEAFKKGVADKFVLVELDYPRKPENKAKQSDAIKKQNKTLRETYKIKGFPTILLMDAKGQPYAKTGYQAGGPEKYLTHLNELQTQRVSRDKALSAAAKLSGIEKAKALIQVLSDLPEEFANNYSDIAAEIKKLDPEDNTGFTRKQEFAAIKAKMESELSDAMRNGKADTLPAIIDKCIADEKLEGEEKLELLEIKLQISVGAAFRSGKAETAPALIDQFIADNKPQGEAKQKLLATKLKVESNVLMRAKKFSEVPAVVDAGITKYELKGENKQTSLSIKIGAYLQDKKFDDAAKVIDAIIAVDPTSDMAKQVETFKPRLQQMKDAAAKEKTNPAHGEPGHVHGDE